MLKYTIFKYLSNIICKKPRINFRFFIVAAVVSVSVAGCKKQDSQEQITTFSRTFHAPTDLHANGCAPLDDGNYVLVSADYSNTSDLRVPGQMVKIDVNGQVLWSKPVSEMVRTVYRVIPLKGVGFAILGIYSSYDFHRNLCIYDLNGNLISINKVITNGWNGYTSHSDIIQLRNGNIAIAGGDEYDMFGSLKILDSSYQILHSKAYFGSGGLKGASLWGICEQVDGKIAMMARGFNAKGYPSLMLIRAGQDGTEISRTLIGNADLAETANTLVPYGEGMLAVTSTADLAIKDGVLVQNTNNFNRVAPMISGRINLLEFDNDGKLIRRKVIGGYHGNGMIRTMRRTPDGGFILCGTVGQSNYTNRISFTSIFCVKLNSKLDIEWQKSIASTYPACGIDIWQMNDGGYLVTGYIRSFNIKLEMMAIKLDANGKL